MTLLLLEAVSSVGFIQLPGYSITKIAASFVLSAYGLYATLTDFKIKKQDKTVLSTKGWIGLAILALGSMCSSWADMRSAIHDQQVKIEENNKELDQQQKHIAELKDEQQKFAAVLSQAERIRRPLTQPTISFELTFAADQIAEFVKANADQASSITEGNQCVLRVFRLPQTDDVLGVARLFKDAGVQLLFDQHTIDPRKAISDPEHSNLHLRNYPFKASQAPPQLAFNQDTSNVHLIEYESPLNRYDDDDGISDIPTLLESNAFIAIESSEGQLANAVKSNQRIIALVFTVGGEHYALRPNLQWHFTKGGIPYLSGKFQDLFARAHSAETYRGKCY